MSRRNPWEDPSYRARHAAAMADPEYRARRSELARAMWADPEARARLHGAMVSPGGRTRRSLASSARWTPELRQQVSEANRATWADPELRARAIEARRNAPFIGECAYCLAPAQTLDHVVPRSRGGSDEPDNLVPACTSCNPAKGDRTPDEWWAALTGMEEPDA